MQNRLSAGLQFKLMELVRDEYSTKGLADTKFADWASQVLQFPVSRHNVGSAREALGIPANFVRGGIRAGTEVDKSGVTNILNELAALQKMVRGLEKRLDVYFGGRA